VQRHYIITVKTVLALVSTCPFKIQSAYTFQTDELHPSAYAERPAFGLKCRKGQRLQGTVIMNYRVATRFCAWTFPLLNPPVPAVSCGSHYVYDGRVRQHEVQTLLNRTVETARVTAHVRVIPLSSDRSPLRTHPNKRKTESVAQSESTCS